MTRTPAQRDRNREVTANWRSRHPRKARVTAAMHNSRIRAKKCEVPWALTTEYLATILPDDCPALGVPLKYTPGPLADNSPTLDRIVPTGGYVPGNVLVLSALANRVKSNATLAQMRAVVAYLESKT